VVGGAGQGARLGQPAGQPLQLAQGVDLPGQVVEPDRAPPGLRGAGGGAELEQTEVVGAWMKAAAPPMVMTVLKPSTSR
jgi:hypothetical protein